MKLIKAALLPSAILFSIASQQAAASGFAITENSASGMGNAFAGIAAAATDASTAWFNPAGLPFLSGSQLVVAAHVISPTAEFSDRGSWVNPALTPDTTTGAPKVTPGSLTGSNDDGGETAFVPNLYYNRALNDKTWFGLAINAPFGLRTDYNPGWVGRYHALTSDVKTVNINPSLAWKVNDQFTFGVGVSAQYINVELSSAIDSTAVCLSLAAQNPLLLSACTAAGLGPGTAGNAANDSRFDIKNADDWSFGFNFGLMFKASDATRIGFAYRSKIKQEPESTGDFTRGAALDAVLTGANIPFLVDTPAKATANLPASASLSLSHQLNNQLQLLADITWTGWSSFEELRIKFDNPLQPDAFTDESWDDVFRYSIGANYQLDDTWVLRGGLALDQEAIPDPQHRTPRVPGNDRTWVSVGVGYKISNRVNLDAGYSHLFVDDTPIDHTSDNGYALRGVYKADVDILSGQLTWKF